MDRPREESSAVTDLGAALTELAGLMMATPTLNDLLDDLSRLATAVLTPPASCGITLRRGGLPLTAASSDALAARLDEVQYGQGDGPCLQALRTGQVTVVTDLATEVRWGSYPAQALAYGTRSSLSLPLAVNGDALGALNLYAAGRDAFGAEEQQKAEIFAVQASAALTVVARQVEQLQLTDQLREALATRAVIDQALGVVMAEQHCDHDAAFAILRTTSQNQNRKLRDVAAGIVESVAGAVPPPTPFNDPA